MHILYIHQYFCPPGGSGNNRSLELARAWVQAGHRVTMLTSTAYFPPHSRSGQDLASFSVDGIEVIALDVPYSHLMRFRDRIRAFLQFYRKGKKLAKGLQAPDLIYASSTPPTVGELGRRLARRWHVPFVFECVDVWPDVPIGMGILRNPLLKSWLNARVNRIYHAADRIITLSDGMREQVLSHGINPDKVKVSYNGTSLTAFPHVERPPRAGLHLIYTGTVGLANGLSVLADLSRLLDSRGVTGVEFTVLGGGNDLARVQARVAELGAKHIRFVPSVPKEEVADWLAKADAGLVTFATYKVLEANSANKFYDYLASGLPVLLNYQGWQAAYLRDWNCGLASAMGDLEALADNVQRLLNDPSLRAEMGNNGRRLAETHFDRSRIAADLLAEFTEIVRRQPLAK